MNTATAEKTYREIFTIDEVMLEYQKVVAQRDELLAALKALCDFGFNTVTSRNANAAITNVEGGLSKKKGKGI